MNRITIGSHQNLTDASAVAAPYALFRNGHVHLDLPLQQGLQRIQGRLISKSQNILDIQHAAVGDGLGLLVAAVGVIARYILSIPDNRHHVGVVSGDADGGRGLIDKAGQFQVECVGCIHFLNDKLTAFQEGTDGHLVIGCEDSQHLQHPLRASRYDTGRDRCFQTVEAAGCRYYDTLDVLNDIAAELGTDLLPATVAFESDGSTDLLYAKSIEYTGQASGNPKVAFTFEHLLSKVYLKVTNNSTAAGKYSFLVKNIKVNAPKTAGTYTIANKTWSATAGNYTFADITVAGGTADAECAAEQLIIPGSATISFDVDILVNGTLVSTTPYTYSTTLAAANAYSFNIQVSVGEPIKFTVENDPTWTKNGDVNIN